MDPRIVTSLQPLQPHPKAKRSDATGGVPETRFKALLHAELKQGEHLKISKHAEQRMEARGIYIEPSTWTMITLKVQEAKERGINESLVITDQAAFIVSVKNQTVITALDRQEATEQIFTNINGTIIL